MKSTRATMFFVWLCFIVRGTFYSAVLPIWEGYDEPFHFAYFQQLEFDRKIPHPDTPISREVQESLHLLPLPWILAQSHLPSPLYSHEQYWRLPPAKRLELEQAFQTIPQSWARERGSETIVNYEAKQMPLYYLLLFPVFHVSNGLALSSQIFLLRSFSVLLASLVVPLGYLIAKSTLKRNTFALGIVVLITALPELMIDLARVGNESLALVVCTLMLYAAVRTAEAAEQFKYFHLLAVALGIGLLTKGYFLTAVPVFFLIAIWSWWRWPNERKRVLFHTVFAIIVLIAIAGPWYWRVHAETGSWSGESYEITLRSMPKLQLLGQALHVNWVSGVVSILLSHIWFGAWSFLKFSRPLYLLFGLIIFAAVLGMCLLFGSLRNRPASQFESSDRSKLAVLLLFYLFFWAGLMYDTLIIYAASGVSASNGWYMYSLVVAEVILLYVGLTAVVPARCRPMIIPGLTAFFVLLDLWGMHLLLIPYYTGITSHVTQDRVPLAGIGQLLHSSVLEFARRLSVNKPPLLQPYVLISLWIVYLATTLLLIPATLGLRSSQHESKTN
jgi:4-amino-4-deoxy-L-arabinose transferase-like glycosyltransferase